MSRVRLTNPQMASFSSYMGVTKFENGISANDVSPREIAILGSITGIEVIEEDGSTHPGGPSNDMITNRGMTAPVETKLIPVGEVQEPIEINAPDSVHTPPKTEEKVNAETAAAKLEAEIGRMEAEAAQTTEAPQTAQIYTRDELEAVADEKGISGLREIGAQYDAKSTSIEGLIEKIISAQASLDNVKA